MREWLYNRIRNLVEVPAPFREEGKVISSGSADNPVAPFMVIQMGVEQPPLGLPASSRTQQIPFTVWVHDAPGSMVRIDNACVALKNHLPLDGNVMVGSMSVYNLDWVNTGDDSYDDHFGTNCRPVRFSMMTRR